MCNCNRDKDCASNFYCKQGDCATPRSGTAYNYGKCTSTSKNVGRPCNYKQCSNKDNGSCECKGEGQCVKGNERGANTCTTSGNLNGCCIDFVGLDGVKMDE